MSPIRRTCDVKGTMERPLHARLGFVATTTTLVVATVGVLAAVLGHQISRHEVAFTSITTLRPTETTSLDLSTCDRFAVIADIIDCGIFNPTDAQTCSACKISGL
ncbi:hypothetical protein KJ925_04305 [Patescibacteria group bacterium]|nr:hypothetical protein [Patescibacteria group bacterium]MBU2613646.1 hypothetical protein [Patescibacteria group bacterium]